MTDTTFDTDAISERSRLLRLAYRMLGSVSAAEDVVQDAYLRLAAQRPPPRSPAAWLTTVTTRLSIDVLRRIKARRETYPGPWLPDPVETTETDEPGDLSTGFLLMLERLSPEERAAFTLREAFGAPYADIAAMLDKSEPAVRQIVSRARTRLQAGRVRPPATTQRHMEFLNSFVAAVVSGDLEAVKSVLAADVRLITDGGGRRSAALRVIEGKDDAASLMHFLAGKDRAVRAVRVLTLNGAPSLFAVDGQGDPFALQIEASQDGIGAIYVFRNPEKLGHLARAAA